MERQGMWNLGNFDDTEFLTSLPWPSTQLPSALTLAAGGIQIALLQLYSGASLDHINLFQRNRCRVKMSSNEI